MFGISGVVLFVVGAVIVATLMLLSFIANLFRKAGPNEALVVYGFGGTRVIKGRGTLIFPMVQSFKSLSLELMSFDVAPQQDLYTKQGVAVTVEAVAQIKVKSDRESIETAAEVISFTIKEVRDKNEYIANMGRPDIARIKMQADIATAEAERDTAIKRAEAQRESAIAQAEADKQRVLAQSISMAAQAEAQRDLEVKRAQYTELVKRQQAQADKSYEIQTQVMQQQVVAESVKVQQIEKEAQIKVQEAEILRHEKELVATVLKGAEIERARIETLAAAERQRLISEAEGRASSVRTEGEAEAEIIFKKGDAEARAMNVKAEAYQEWNQAAVIDKLISNMPEMVRALAAPLSNIDKITIVSTGDGSAAGAHKITGDITAMAAQVPALFEALSGMQMSDLLAKVRLIGDKTGSDKPSTTVVPAPNRQG